MIGSYLRRHANRLLLYTGLCLLLISLIIRNLYGSSPIWIPIFCAAILFKTAFLIITLRSRKFKWSLWLILIIAGVVMIFTSLVFKYLLPIPLLRGILFYGAIILKTGGLVLLFSQKAFLKKQRKNQQ